ncbi:hypothetical protein F383_10560 [Gossypium arboreum]|uniref:Uncharacterized protein n=1 Tax=Gossypium arboreum TaxID=29729 RepID=A0A0B0N862_GOSAR|nr:hypothetical protein F383_10560 [Gossypium arboreum]
MYIHCNLNFTLIILITSPLTFIFHFLSVVKQFIYIYVSYHSIT